MLAVSSGKEYIYFLCVGKPGHERLRFLQRLFLKNPESEKHSFQRVAREGCFHLIHQWFEVQGQVHISE